MQHDWQPLDDRDAERCRRCGWLRLGIDAAEWSQDLRACPGPSKEEIERGKETIRLLMKRVQAGDAAASRFWLSTRTNKDGTGPGPSKEQVAQARQTIRHALENSTIVRESA